MASFNNRFYVRNVGLLAAIDEAHEEILEEYSFANNNVGESDATAAHSLNNYVSTIRPMPIADRRTPITDDTGDIDLRYSNCELPRIVVSLVDVEDRLGSGGTGPCMQSSKTAGCTSTGRSRVVDCPTDIRRVERMGDQELYGGYQTDQYIYTWKSPQRADAEVNFKQGISFPGEKPLDIPGKCMAVPFRFNSPRLEIEDDDDIGNTGNSFEQMWVMDEDIHGWDKVPL